MRLSIRVFDTCQIVRNAPYLVNKPQSKSRTVRMPSALPTSRRMPTVRRPRQQRSLSRRIGGSAHLVRRSRALSSRCGGAEPVGPAGVELGAAGEPVGEHDSVGLGVPGGRLVLSTAATLRPIWSEFY